MLDFPKGCTKKQRREGIINDPFHTEKRVFSCQSVKTSELVTEFIYLEYPTGIIVTILNKAKRSSNWW